MKKNLTPILAAVLLISVLAIIGHSALSVAIKMGNLIEQHRQEQLERIKEGTIYEF